MHWWYKLVGPGEWIHPIRLINLAISKKGPIEGLNLQLIVENRPPECQVVTPDYSDNDGNEDWLW